MHTATMKDLTPHTLRYGVPNVLKNYYLLSEFYELGLAPSVDNILDIGCGPGTFSLAHLLWNMDHPDLLANPYKFVMADGAGEFLTLCKLLWNDIDAIEKERFNIEMIPSVYKGTLPTEMNNPDMIVLSNSLAEVLRDQRVNNNSLINSFIESKAIIFIIDYNYKNTTEALNKFTADLYPHYRSLSFYNWPHWNDFFQLVDLSKIDYPFNSNLNQKRKITSNVKFLKAILVPRDNSITTAPPAYNELVMQYKKAWEEHNVDILHDLFTSDAIYQEKEGQEPFIGIESICNYWNINAKQQVNVKFNPLFTSQDGESLKCIWKCEFYRRDLRRWMFLNGVFTARITNNKISIFKEYFEKTITDTEPLKNNREY